MTGPLRVGSCFSGLGGIDLAFQNAGAVIAWQIEIDPACNRVLARHWPDVPRYGDIRTLRGDDLAPVDILAGGFPCQDVSVAGNRAGLAGARSGLFFEFLRLVDECAPTWICIENVPGLRSSGSGRDMGAIVGALAERGFWWAYRSLDAQYFGVAQRRERVFIVGHARKRTYPVQVLFESDGSPWDSPPSREAGAGVAATLSAGASATGGVNPPGRRREDDEILIVGPVSGGNFGSGQRTEDDPNLILTPVAALRGNHYGDHDGATSQLVVSRSLNGHHPRSDGDTETLIAHTLSSEGADASEDGTGRGVPLVPLYYSHDYNQDRIYDGHGIAPAVTSRDSNGARNVFTPTMGVRRLMPIECLRLQALPDDWLDSLGLSDSAKYRMIGNSVAEVVVEWLARRLVNVAQAVS